MGGGVAVTEFGPTKETVLALLELLVEPLLPSVSSIAKDKPPSPVQQESVAKQVQAVVLLYDYYHRKCNPELEFLDHVSFGKLAVELKPSLLPYMKVVQKDDENELSLMDKMIIEACDISKSLDTSKAESTGWPIVKVAVFLVDSSKESCFLLHSSYTQGVWSLIEKDQSPEGMVEEKTGNKKKKITKKPLKENQNADETALQQLAFAAVKDASGCSRSDLKILESHTVYSLSKAKTAARFYIMQCKKTKQEDNFVPIRDVLDSLQGPLVTKESCGWSTTSVVEYFHLLPYADILTDWPSREPTMEASQEAGAGVEQESSEQENSEQLPTDSNCEDNEREQIQKVTSISSEVSAPCKVPQKEDTDTGKCNTTTKANTSLKVDAGKEDHIHNKAIPDNTSVLNGQGLEVKNQSKEVPSRILRSGLKLENMKEADRTEEPVVYTKRKNSMKKDKVHDDLGCKSSKAGPECSIQKDIQISVSGLSINVEVDEPVSSADCSMDGKNSMDGKKRSSSGEDRVANEMKTMVSQNSQPTPTHVVTKEEIVSTLQNGENNSTGVKAIRSSQDAVQDNAVVPFDSNTRKLDKVHKAFSLRENVLSEAALTALYRKRDILSYQLRSVGDEINICDRNIQAILDGSEDDLGVKLDSILEGCNIVNSSNGVSTDERIYQHSQDQNVRKCRKRKRLCEAKLRLASPCQELDDICYENFWVLPTYSVSTSDGGFEAAVTVKGVDFECSSKGGTCSSPQGARESAASSVLIKLRGLASAS